MSTASWCCARARSTGELLHRRLLLFVFTSLDTRSVSGVNDQISTHYSTVAEFIEHCRSLLDTLFLGNLLQCNLHCFYAFYCLKLDVYHIVIFNRIQLICCIIRSNNEICGLETKVGLILRPRLAWSWEQNLWSWTLDLGEEANRNMFWQFLTQR